MNTYYRLFVYVYDQLSTTMHMTLYPHYLYCTRTCSVYNCNIGLIVNHFVVRTQELTCFCLFDKIGQIYR